MDTLYQYIIKKAFQHGEDSEPDHEIGDLQDCLREALKLMTKTQRTKLQHIIKKIL